MDADLVTLCQACGLCCDGSLFGRAALEPAERAAARKNRLRVLDDARGFEQPCSALAAVETAAGAVPRRSCSIYAERPVSCRRFTCRLYERHRREGGPLEPRLEAIRRVRQLLSELEASGYRPGDLERPAPEGLSELTQRLEDFARAP
jgi:Fe-S-cluster containining protein